jgi:hypothetical protein
MSKAPGKADKLIVPLVTLQAKILKTRLHELCQNVERLSLLIKELSRRQKQSKVERILEYVL